MLGLNSTSSALSVASKPAGFGVGHGWVGTGVYQSYL